MHLPEPPWPTLHLHKRPLGTQVRWHVLTFDGRCMEIRRGEDTSFAARLAAGGWLEVWGAGGLFCELAGLHGLGRRAVPRRWDAW